MRWSLGFFAVAACFFTRPVFAADCAAPPVRSSEQATCYAVAYAERHRLSHGDSLTRSVAKGQKLWTVRFLNDRAGARLRGWEVDIDAASGKVTRFTSYRPVGPSKG
jgi:hypothetical protein